MPYKAMINQRCIIVIPISSTLRWQLQNDSKQRHNDTKEVEAIPWVLAKKQNCQGICEGNLKQFHHLETGEWNSFGPAWTTSYSVCFGCKMYQNAISTSLCIFVRLLKFTLVHYIPLDTSTWNLRTYHPFRSWAWSHGTTGNGPPSRRIGAHRVSPSFPRWRSPKSNVYRPEVSKNAKLT